MDQTGNEASSPSSEGALPCDSSAEPDDESHIEKLWSIESELPTAVVEDPEFAIELFESSPDAIIIVDGKGMMRLVNRQAELMFGYHRSEVIDRPVEMLIPPGARERHARHREFYAEEPRIRPMGAGHDLIALRKDGATFDVEINLSPIVTRRGGFVIATVRRRRQGGPVERRRKWFGANR